MSVGLLGGGNVFEAPLPCGVTRFQDAVCRNCFDERNGCAAESIECPVEHIKTVYLTGG